MHMLLHAAEFAKKHRFLGRVSEAPIESIHASMNALYNINHRNMSTHPDVRITRSLSDQVYRSSAGGPLRDITNTVQNRARPPTRGTTI
jgi:hypothetical protein